MELKIMIMNLEILQERMSHKVKNVMQTLDKILFYSSITAIK
jgi:hypothetical protein